MLEREKELSHAMYSLETAKTALGELDALKARNQELELKLEETYIETRKEELKLKSELEETKETLTESSNLIEEMKSKMDALNNA